MVDRSDIECQADWSEHVDKSVEAELADFSVEQIGNSRLGDVKVCGSIGLGPTFFFDSLLDRDHEPAARREVSGLLWSISEVVEHAVSHLVPPGSASDRRPLMGPQFEVHLYQYRYKVRSHLRTGVEVDHRSMSVQRPDGVW